MNLEYSRISLYIHIPFCSSKCNYCDFYSETKGFDRLPIVVSEIINQLKNRYKLFGSPKVETVFIGGGTPSILPDHELKRLLQAVKDIAPDTVEWSIESNPESITENFLNIALDAGVNRLSIGIQSFNPKSLKMIGRKATVVQIDKALEIVKRVWTEKLSLDLISSLPEQNENMVLDDIKSALSYEPDHISFYALSLEEDTPLEDQVSKGLVTELSEEVSEQIWLKGRSLLNRSGYDNYEVSNYTKNSPSLHNISYWELKPYLGIGPGAVSTLIQDDGTIVRISNDKSIDNFILGESIEWGEHRVELSPKDFFEDYVIMGLRLKKGIDCIRFKKIFHKNIDEIIPIIGDLINEGLANISTNYFNLTKKGFDIMNSILIRILRSTENVTIEFADWYY